MKLISLNYLKNIFNWDTEMLALQKIPFILLLPIVLKLILQWMKEEDIISGTFHGWAMLNSEAGN